MLPNAERLHSIGLNHELQMHPSPKLRVHPDEGHGKWGWLDILENSLWCSARTSTLVYYLQLHYRLNFWPSLARLPGTNVHESDLAYVVLLSENYWGMQSTWILTHQRPRLCRRSFLVNSAKPSCFGVSPWGTLTSSSASVRCSSLRKPEVRLSASLRNLRSRPVLACSTGGWTYKSQALYLIA